MRIWRPLLVGLSLWTMACGPDVPPECTSAAECDDGEQCTADLCDQGVCVNNPDDTIIPAQGSPLDCRQEVCSGGRLAQVNDDTEQPNDNVPCTADVCVGGAPQFTPNNNICGAAPDCRALVCDPQGQQGTPNADGCSAITDDTNLPDDGADCTDDTCLNGNPVFTPDNAVCDTGATGCATDSCDPNNAASDPITGCVTVLSDAFCDDGNFCTSDTCDPINGDADGCVIVPTAGQATQIPGNCNLEICNNGNPSQTPDDNDLPAADTDNIACTVAGCAGGQITETPTNALCDDSLSCTKDTCDPTNPIADPTSGCTAEAEADTCPAGQACDPASDPGQTNNTGCVEADTCPPTLVITDGQTLDSSTIGNLDDASPSCADNTGAHPDLAFGFSLNEDSDIILSASPIDGQALSLQLVSLSGGVCGAELHCIAANATQDADMNIINLAAGDYAIIVDGNGATLQEGRFSLSLIADATALLDGDLVINEVHDDVGSPLADANGEFLEIANPSAVFAVSTAGLTLVEEDGTPFTQTLTANGVDGEQLIIPAGGFLLGVPSADTGLNGGLTRDFDLNFGLNNTPNETLQIFKGALLIDQVNLVAVGSPSNNDGVSFQLDVALTDALLNDAAASWCLTPTNVYSTNNRGTPGEPNESCAAPECTVGTQAVDCNDNQPCTDDVCTNGSCQNVNDNTNTPAADAFSCTSEACQNGVTVITFNDNLCNDNVGCTLDGCIGTGGQVGTGCEFLADDTECNANEFCDPVNDCQAGAPVCGNGLIEAGEECDGGATCDAACQRIPICGDTFIDAPETCDDGGLLSGDGCSAICQIEVPPTCGNGAIDAGETCDDGNQTADGNGCAATCNVDHLTINEIDYDMVGTDNAEYIEIFNGTGAPVSLAGIKVILINGTAGNPGAPYATIDLSSGGTLPAGGFLVIANAAFLGTITADVEIAFAGNNDQIQNGNAEGVALINDDTNVLIDALSYEGSVLGNLSTFGIGDASGVSLVEGTVFVGADSNTVDGSVARIGNRDNNNANADWATPATKTPGATNP